MIISHKHKFIFIKTKKTAGTSLEIALSAICGDEDVITPISPIDEKARADLGYLGAQNYSEMGFFNHMSAQKASTLISADVWSSYYKFCFERNPWDKVISWYYWEIKNGRPMSFDHFMGSGHFTKVGGLAGYDLYTDKQGSLMVDDVYLFENMTQEITKIQNRLGVVLPKLPHAKSHYREDKQPYAQVYTDQYRDLVLQAFKREIARFNYCF